MAVLLLLCGAVTRSNAAAQTDGAALYQKHCTGCHPDGAKLQVAEPLLSSLRVPPPGMPLFGEDKLSNSEVRAIAEYLQPGAQPSSTPKRDPEPKAPAKAGKSSKEKKSWMKGFGTSDL